jgi:hypothetical protein
MLNTTLTDSFRIHFRSHNRGAEGHRDFNKLEAEIGSLPNGLIQKLFRL